MRVLLTFIRVAVFLQGLGRQPVQLIRNPPDGLGASTLEYLPDAHLRTQAQAGDIDLYLELDPVLNLGPHCTHLQTDALGSKV